MIQQATVGTNTLDTIESVVTVLGAQTALETSTSQATFSTTTIRVAVAILDTEAIGTEISSLADIVLLSLGTEETREPVS